MTAREIKKYQKKSISDLIRIATTHFNRFIRERDIRRSCVSCGRQGTLQAGHYLSGGHHAIHRFNEFNVHGQCLGCNFHLHGNLINYRIELVNRIGEDKLKWLEGTRHTSYKWDRFTLIDIILKYKNVSDKK